jgi:TolB-like protein/class 3 adenylate cyclase/Tfp pilus assembly protein PilF
MSKKHRQLAAIVFTDIVGYSKMMREDEAKATLIRERHRSVFDQLTPEYGGKILQYYGDGTLSVFQSSVAAVECCVEMQKAFQQDPMVPLRIGIHTGDITFSKEEVFGDGLNIAARIESSCIPGGIFISGKVYDDIKNHPQLSVKNVGQFQFKGINEFMDLYALDCEGLPIPDAKLSHLKGSKAKLSAINFADSKSQQALPFYKKNTINTVLAVLLLLAVFFVRNNFIQKTGEINQLSSTDFVEHISIAVLPFSNFSADTNDEYFSDGITEDILTVLSSIKDFRVISRTSVMQYKDTKKSIREIGKELNVTHILEGSVRKSDNKVRVVAQLIDARNDAHVWAHTYDREMTEIFEVQSELAENIAGKLKKELSPEDYRNLNKKPTNDLQAYDLYLQGRKYYTKYNEKDNDVAIQLFESALEIDSSFALAYAGLGDALSQKGNYRKGDPKLLKTALKISKKAIEIDNNSSEGYKAIGLSYHYMGDTEKALESYHKAVEINPNNEMAISNIAMICRENGDIVEGIRWASKAKELNPQHPMSFIRLSDLYESIGMDENAESILEEGHTWNPENEDLNLKLGEVVLKLGNLDKVIVNVENLEKIYPKSPNTFMLKGRVAFVEKDYKKAQELYLKAQEIVAQDEGAKYYYDIDLGLALIDNKLNKESDSSPQLEKILSKILEKEAQPSKMQTQLRIASIYAELNKKDEAILYLEKAVQSGFLDYRMLEVNPLFENIRHIDSFKRIKDEVQTKAEKIQKEINKGYDS